MASTYSVQQGDTLISIAQEHGFRDWRTIWDHAGNRALRERRRDPQELYPGDQVYVPDKRPRVESCETEKRHRFKLRPLRAHVRVALEDEDGKPYSGKKYKLEVSGQTFEGKTGGRGVVEHEVPPDAKTGKLTLWASDAPGDDPLVWQLRIGELDPIDTDTGLLSRLANLGFAAGPDGLDGALRAFQRAHGLDDSGALDGPTRDRLDTLHDSI